MSAIAEVLARMGHTVSGSDLKDSHALDPPRGCSASTTHVGHDGRQRRPTAVDAVVVSTRDPGDEPRGRRGPRARHPRLPPRRGAARARRHPARDRRRREPRQDHDVLDARPDPARRGLASQLPHRRRRQRGGDERRVRRRRVARRRGRRERRHVPRARTGGGDRHQHRARPSRPLRRLRRARPPRSTTFLEAVPGTRVVCADDPVVARLAAAIRERCTYGFGRQAPTTASPGYEGGRPAAGSCSSTPRRAAELGVVELPVPGRHNAANAAGAAAARARARRSLRRR